MRAEPTCPRCGAQLQAPGLWSSDWICGLHGAVLPRQPSVRPGPDALSIVLRDVRVPVWTLWPLPLNWLVTGFVVVGDGRSGACACGVALSGPGLLSGPADMLLIAEEPGIGLGAHYAGLEGADPGEEFDGSPPHAKIGVSGPAATSGHSVPMWSVGRAPDRAAFVGEALGHWLWAVLWPADAGALMLEGQNLLDLREPGMNVDLPYGARSEKLEA